jgi:hypothetical protein
MHTTHNIANKGFSGMRRVVARFNFSCNLIGIKPEIPYRPYCQRYHQLEKQYE